MDHLPVFERLKFALQERGVSFNVLVHAPAYTSAESAAVRGVPLHWGAKALILKLDDTFRMLVLPADYSLSSSKVKKQLQCRRIRFADGKEVESLTGLAPGAIPPFGSLFNLSTFCDERLLKNEFMYFNAGSHTDSIQLSTADYLIVENPLLGVFGDERPTED